MANTFTRKVSANVGTALTAIGSYTVAASTQTTVIGLTQKIVMVTGDSIRVNSDAASSIDAVLSILEIT